MCTLGSDNLGRHLRTAFYSTALLPRQVTHEGRLTAFCTEAVCVAGGCTDTQKASSLPQVRERVPGANTAIRAEQPTLCLHLFCAMDSPHN